MGFLPWEIRVAFPREAVCDRVALPKIHRILPHTLTHKHTHHTINYTTLSAFSCTSGPLYQDLTHTHARARVYTESSLLLSP